MSSATLPLPKTKIEVRRPPAITDKESAQTVTLPASNYTLAPNELMECLAGKCSSVTEMGIVLLLIRLTYGGKGRPRFVSVTQEEFRQALRCATTEAVQQSIDALAARGFVVCRSSGRKNLYAIEAQAIIEARPKPLRELTKKPPAAESEMHSREEAPRRDALVVMPGKDSRPMRLSAAVEKVAYRNKSSSPVALSAAPDEGGVLWFEIRDVETPTGVGVSHESNTPTGVGVLKNGFVETNDVTSLRQIEELLTPTFLNKLGKAPDEGLLERIRAELNKGQASVEEYKLLLAGRLRGGVENLKSGLFVSLAREAAAAARKRAVILADQEAWQRKAEEENQRDLNEHLLQSIERALLAGDSAEIADLKRDVPELFEEARSRVASRRTQ